MNRFANGEGHDYQLRKLDLCPSKDKNVRREKHARGGLFGWRLAMRWG